MKQYRSYNKYGNKSARCLNKDHATHHSKGEANYCNHLFADLKEGKIKNYETQKSYRLMVNGRSVGSHIVDFVVENNDGSIEVHEYKGFETQLWKLKRALFEVIYPDIPYIVKKG